MFCVGSQWKSAMVVFDFLSSVCNDAAAWLAAVLIELKNPSQQKLLQKSHKKLNDTQ